MNIALLRKHKGKLSTNAETPKIPPLHVMNVFVLNCAEKAKLFNYFFLKQCTLIMTSSVLPTFNFLTDK